MALNIAQQYVDAFSKLARTNNTILLPSNLGDPASMVAQVKGGRGWQARLCVLTAGPPTL